MGCVSSKQEHDVLNCRCQQEMNLLRKEVRELNRKVHKLKGNYDLMLDNLDRISSKKKPSPQKKL